MSSTSFIASQPCADTSYGPSTTTPSFLPKTGDFPQVGTSSHSHPSMPWGPGGPCLALAALARLWAPWSRGLYLRTAGVPAAPTWGGATSLSACRSCPRRGSWGSLRECPIHFPKPQHLPALDRGPRACSVWASVSQQGSATLPVCLARATLRQVHTPSLALRSPNGRHWQCNPAEAKEEIRVISFWGGTRWSISGKCPSRWAPRDPGVGPRCHRDDVGRAQVGSEAGAGGSLAVVRCPQKCGALGATGSPAPGVEALQLGWPQGLSSPAPQLSLSSGVCGASRVAVWEDAAQSRQLASAGPTRGQLGLAPSSWSPARVHAAPSRAADLHQRPTHPSPPRISEQDRMRKPGLCRCHLVKDGDQGILEQGGPKPRGSGRDTEEKARQWRR